MERATDRTIARESDQTDPTMTNNLRTENDTDTESADRTQPWTLSRFQQDILFVLLEGDRTGQGLRRALETEASDGDVHNNRLYPNLDTLVERGLVEKREADWRSETNAITDAGRELIGERLRWELSKGGFGPGYIEEIVGDAIWRGL